MWMVKLTRSNLVDGVYSRAYVAGPYEEDFEAKYQAKQIQQGDTNPDSEYETVVVDWVVVMTRPVKRKGEVPVPEVISWFETEEEAKANAAVMQRGDYSVVIEPKKWPI